MGVVAACGTFLARYAQPSHAVAVTPERKILSVGVGVGEWPLSVHIAL
jgi:hypothetical protein